MTNQSPLISEAQYVLVLTKPIVNVFMCQKCRTILGMRGKLNGKNCVRFDNVCLEKFSGQCKICGQDFYFDGESLDNLRDMYGWINWRRLQEKIDVNKNALK